MHNKPGKPPLCSSTKTGKIIDAIIKQLDFEDCIKTNLMDVDVMPNDYSTVKALATDWVIRIKPSEYDIIILLGTFVQFNFPRVATRKKIKAAHPGSLWSSVKEQLYIASIVNKIKELL